MSSPLPPLNPLRAFEATARLGSITAAARELKVTHGAISHQIRTLEDCLATSLFVRGGKRLKLTSQGALLLPGITSAFGEISAATALMRQPEARGDLTIACVPALLSLWLMPRLNSFTDQYPDVRLTLVASNDPEKLRSRDTDLCILYGKGDWPDYWTQLWSRLEIFPVASPALLNSRPLRLLRDLSDHTLFHADDGREWKTWLSSANANGLVPGREHFMGDARLSTEAALHGHGIALVDTITPSHLIARGKLVAPFNLKVPVEDGLFVACRKPARHTPLVEIFINWLFTTRDEIPQEPVPPAATGAAGLASAFD